ncbi:MAG: GtrA family protein, partial [Hyphococcus sp.]
MMQQLIRYGIVGLANTAFGLSLIYVAMGAFGLAPALANAAGFAGAFIVSYWLNRRWTFRSDAHVGSSLTGFAVACAIGYA